MSGWRSRGCWPGFPAASEQMVLKPGFSFGCEHQPGAQGYPYRCARMHARMLLLLLRAVSGILFPDDGEFLSGDMIPGR